MLLTHLQLGRRSPSGSALVDGPLTVGWIRPGIIGFGGFEDHAEAHAAATAAEVVMGQWSIGRPAEDRIVARVLEPAAVKTDLPGHGFEIAVPQTMWLAVMLELAQRIHSTLLGSRRTAEGAVA